MTINMKPTIHMNGTSREALLDQTTEAWGKVNDAISALCHMRPNGRDYYPQGSSAYGLADDEHCERITKLNEVLQELQVLAEHIADS